MEQFSLANNFNKEKFGKICSLIDVINYIYPLANSAECHINGTLKLDTKYFILEKHMGT